MKHTNQQLCFDPLYGLILGYFLPPQFLIYHFLFQVALLQHVPFVEFNPDTQENKETTQIILMNVFKTGKSVQCRKVVYLYLC